MQVLEKYKTLEPLDALDILTAPENIRKNLKSENDIYKFEYCSLDEKIYKIASYIPLEWENGKLVKVLLASMDVTQEKKAEIESRQALKEAYRSAENANRAKTEFLSNMSHDIRTPMNAIVGLTAIAGANIESQERIRPKADTLLFSGSVSIFFSRNNFIFRKIFLNFISGSLR